MLSSVLRWFSGRTRTRRLTRHAISDALWLRTLESLPLLFNWSDTDLARLRETATFLTAGKEFTTAHDLPLTGDMMVSITAQASVPVLELDITWYNGWYGVVTYPGEFVVRKEVMDEDGVVHNVHEGAAGEAWEHGSVILSRQDIELGGALATPGTQPYNVVVHEFAHKFDMLNGRLDSIPAFSSRLHANADREQWADDLYAECGMFVNRYEQIPERRWGDNPILSVLDPYGAQHSAEFFAVASEVSFIGPVALLEALPSLYALLQTFYLQGSARRVLGSEQRQEGSLP